MSGLLRKKSHYLITKIRYKTKRWINKKYFNMIKKLKQKLSRLFLEIINKKTLN